MRFLPLAGQQRGGLPPLSRLRPASCDRGQCWAAWPSNQNGRLEVMNLWTTIQTDGAVVARVSIPAALPTWRTGAARKGCADAYPKLHLRELLLRPEKIQRCQTAVI